MGAIPGATVPLAKFIRTGEGILVFAFNLTLLIVPIVSNALTPEDAVKWAGIVNGVAVICRTGLKVVSVMQGVTGIPPAQIGPVLTPEPSSVPNPVPGRGSGVRSGSATRGDRGDAGARAGPGCCRRRHRSRHRHRRPRTSPTTRSSRARRRRPTSTRTSIRSCSSIRPRRTGEGSSHDRSAHQAVVRN